MSEVVEVTGADTDLASWFSRRLPGYTTEPIARLLARHRHEATRALMTDMPTIMIDPAGKGYPCMERPMTPAEAKWALEDMDQRNVALSAQVEELREGLEAVKTSARVGQPGSAPSKSKWATIPSTIYHQICTLLAKHKETGA